MEIGSPMASMYLLKNPDHYTSHKFIPFWWKSFINNIAKSEMSDEISSEYHVISKETEDIAQEERENILTGRNSMIMTLI